MNSVGFLISHKNNEKRRALLPEDLSRINCLDSLLFEEGYGESLGITDAEYTEKGVRFAPRGSAEKDCRTHSYLDYGYAPLLRHLHGLCFH